MRQQSRSIFISFTEKKAREKKERKNEMNEDFFLLYVLTREKRVRVGMHEARWRLGGRMIQYNPAIAHFQVLFQFMLYCIYFIVYF